MPRPTTVSAASWIWLATALVTTITIVNVVTASGFLAFMAEVTAAEDELPVVGVISGAGLAMAVVLFVGMAVQLISVLKLRDGAAWARIVLVLASVLSLGGIISDVTSWSAWLPLVGNVIAVVLVFMPTSSAFLAPSRQTALA